MNGSPPYTNPLDVARHAQDMGKREPNDRTLKWLTVGMLLLTGVATAFHTIHTLVRDVRGRERDNGRGDRRPPAPASPPEHADTYEDEPSSDGRKWSQRQELADRQPDDHSAQAVHSRQHGHVRQH
jgi:hypothetical protein